MVKKEWIEKGFVDEPVDATLDLKQENADCHKQNIL